MTLLHFIQQHVTYQAFITNGFSYFTVFAFISFLIETLQVYLSKGSKILFTYSYNNRPRHGFTANLFQNYVKYLISKYLFCFLKGN